MSQSSPQEKGDRRKWDWPVFSCKSDDGETDPDEDDDEDAADVVDGDAPTVVVRLLTRLSTWEFFASRFFLQLVYFFSLKNVSIEAGPPSAHIGEKTDLLLRILIPPSLFQCLQLPLVQQLQDPENCKRVLSVIKYIFPSWCWWLHAGICSSWSQAADSIIIIIAIIMTILTYASLNWSLRGLPCWTARA